MYNLTLVEIYICYKLKHFLDQYAMIIEKQDAQNEKLEIEGEIILSKGSLWKRQIGRRW